MSIRRVVIGVGLVLLLAPMTLFAESPSSRDASDRLRERSSVPSLADGGGGCPGCWFAPNPAWCEVTGGCESEGGGGGGGAGGGGTPTCFNCYYYLEQTGPGTYEGRAACETPRSPDAGYATCTVENGNYCYTSGTPTCLWT